MEVQNQSERSERWSKLSPTTKRGSETRFGKSCSTQGISLPKLLLVCDRGVQAGNETDPPFLPTIFHEKFCFVECRNLCHDAQPSADEYFGINPSTCSSVHSLECRIMESRQSVHCDDCDGDSKGINWIESVAGTTPTNRTLATLISSNVQMP